MPYRDHTIIATVFAGRRDRLPLLLHRLDQLAQQRLVDEIHLWDYCKTDDDRRWLQSLGAPPKVTPDEYAFYGHTPLYDADTAYAFNVRGTAHDVVLLLHGNDGREYELGLGCWDNTKSVFRQGAQNPDALAETDALRIRPPQEWTNVALDWSAGTVLLVTVDASSWSIALPEGLSGFTGVAHSSGFGHGAVYDVLSARTPLRYCKPAADDPRWMSYYSHYAAHAASLYHSTILVKCDDDLVALDTDAFQGFLDFRIDQPSYSLVIPNIVNNDAAVASLKARRPAALRDVQGWVYQSADNGARVHAAFLEDPDAFSGEGHEEIAPGQRVSINMFAVLPWMLADFADAAAAQDDEAYLTEHHLGTKALYLPLRAVHLSFGPQEELGLDIDSLLKAYASFTFAAHPSKATHETRAAPPDTEKKPRAPAAARKPRKPRAKKAAADPPVLPVPVPEPESTPELAPQSTPQSLSELAAEPVAEPAAEPAAEPVAEPAADPRVVTID